MRHRCTATVLATVLMAASVQAQNGASPSRLFAIGNGATTPLCKNLAAIADAQSSGTGPSVVRAIPAQELNPPFAKIWWPAEASQLTPELIRHIAQDRYRLDAQRELDLQTPLTAPGATAIPSGRYDARAEEIGVAKLRAAIAEGKLVVERATVDVTGTGKLSTALHIGIRSDAQQAYHLIDWSVHLIADAFVSREDADKPSIIGLLRDSAPSRLSDIVRYGGKDYFVSASMAARHIRMQGSSASIVTVCDGTARLADSATKR